MICKLARERHFLRKPAYSGYVPLFSNQRGVHGCPCQGPCGSTAGVGVLSLDVKLLNQEVMWLHHGQSHAISQSLEAAN